MSRKYPRYVYSNPQNTKSKGPFIIHLLKPTMICRLVDDRTEDVRLLKGHHLALCGWCLELLEAFDETDDDTISMALEDMLLWASNQNEILQDYKNDVFPINENKFYVLLELIERKFSKQIDRVGDFARGCTMFYKPVGPTQYIIFNTPNENKGKTVDCFLATYDRPADIINKPAISINPIKLGFKNSTDWPLVAQYLDTEQ